MLTLYDNSFQTSYRLNPLQLGVDIVIEDTQILTSGQNDIKLGFLVITKDSPQGLYDRLFMINKSVGDAPGPLDIYLCHRHIKTMQIRID